MKLAVLLLVAVFYALPSFAQDFPVGHWKWMNSKGDGNVTLYGSEGRPKVRGWTQASFDAETRKMVLFGGSASTYMSDTWTYKLSENFWHLRQPHPDLDGPCRRDNHSLVYSPLDKKHYLFGGIVYDNLQPGCDRVGEWTFDTQTNTWRKYASGTEPHRLAAGYAYDLKRNKIVMFGGGDVNNTNETWEFDPASKAWSKIAVTGQVPLPRTNIQHAFVYEKKSGKFVLFGGRLSAGAQAGGNGPTQLNDTWVFDPVRKTWTNMNPVSPPEGRDMHAMVYIDVGAKDFSPLQGKIVMVGGRSFTADLGETWTYDLESNTWTDLTARVGTLTTQFRDASLGYDPVENAIFLSGPVWSLKISDVGAKDVSPLPAPPEPEPIPIPQPEPAPQPAPEPQPVPAPGHDGAKDVSPLSANRPFVHYSLPAFGTIDLRGGLKHNTCARNTIDGRIYCAGGDWGGGGFSTSYRQEVYSFSMAGGKPSDWKVEYPYCGGTPPQPQHPDFMGWQWDRRRNIYWMIPGLYEGAITNCPDEPGPNYFNNRVAQFDPVTKKWIDYAPGGLGDNQSWHATYDEVTDKIYQFLYDGAHGQAVGIFDPVTKKWSYQDVSSSGAKHITVNYAAFDKVGRAIYAADKNNARLYRYLIDSKSFQDIGPLPVPLAGITSAEMAMVFDSLNGVLYYHNHPKGIYAYKVATKQWTTLPALTVDGLPPSGRNMFIDDVNRVLVLYGQTAEGFVTDQMFVYPLDGELPPPSPQPEPAPQPEPEPQPQPEPAPEPIPTPKTFILAVLSQGSGTVTSRPAGISCRSHCSTTFASGTSVILQAVPASGYSFAGWSGDADCTDGSVTMTGNKSCRAIFAAKTVTKTARLNVNVVATVTSAGAGKGTVTSNPAGIHCKTDCAARFASGTSVTLTATPASGSVFTGWSGDSDCTDGSVTMSSNKSCAAIFAVPAYMLNISVSGNGKGRVTGRPGSIDCVSNCSQTFATPTRVVLRAMPSLGSAFVGWSGDRRCAAGVIVTNGSIACTANFVLRPSNVGLFNPTTHEWHLKHSLDATAGGCAVDLCVSRWQRKKISTLSLVWIPIVGDWNGSGTDGLGIYWPAGSAANGSRWRLDRNGNDKWNGCDRDRCIRSFGQEGDLPVAGDWNGTGKANIGVFRPSQGEWLLDLDGDRQWGGCKIDSCITAFGQQHDVPVTGDWNSTGTTKIGIYRPSTGEWFLDLNGNGQWNGCNVDLCIAAFGEPGDLPVAGDWDGTGISKVGLFRPSTGEWFLDLNGNGQWEGCNIDKCLTGFGQEGDLPVAGRW